MLSGGQGDDGLRARHLDEVRRVTRTTGLMAGGVLLTAWPLWAVFDQVHEPDRAGAFLTVRLVIEILLVPVLGCLWHRRFGTRHAELLVLVMLGLPQAAIGWMVARLDGPVDPYLLGFSLPLFGSAVLLIWRPRFTAALIAIAVSALVVALSTAPEPPTAADLATITFYVGTAAVVSFVGQAYRCRLAWNELVGRAAVEREQERSERLLRELERASREDALTGVANRRRWDELTTEAVDRARRSRGDLAVVLCDIDHSKHVNDRHGHARGDAVLRSVAEHIVGGVRDRDEVARIGGDEFAVLCPQTGLHDAADLAARLRSTTDAAGDAIAVTISFGLAALEGDDATTDQLLARADGELYRAKLTRDAVCAAGRRWDPAS